MMQTNNFKMRAEAQIDFIKFLQKYFTSLTKYSMELDKESFTVNIEITTTKNISEVLKTIDTITDAHVMYRTLNHKNNYTGEIIRTEN